jgi:hypothetical protein
MKFIDIILIVMIISATVFFVFLLFICIIISFKLKNVIREFELVLRKISFELDLINQASNNIKFVYKKLLHSFASMIVLLFNNFITKKKNKNL